MPTPSQAIDAPLEMLPEIRRGALRRHRWLIAAIVLFLVATVGVVLFFRSRPKAPPVATTPVERRTIVHKVELNGHLDVTRRVEVPAPRAGALQTVLAAEGKRVERGETLAVLDDQVAENEQRGAKSALEAANGRVRAAVVRLEAAAASLERAKRLRERELASDAELEAARAEDGRARADVATARAERSKAGTGLSSAELAVSQTKVEAPISGIVLRAPRTTGGAVSPELEPLFVIGSELGTLRIDAEVSESEVGELKAGQPATFTVPAYPKRTFSARVERVGVDARREAAAVKYPVELRADNASDLLRPAMTATITIPVASAENVLVARDAALRFRPEDAREAPARSRVFRVAPEGLVEVPVVTGLSDGTFTEIRPRAPGALQVGVPLAIGPSTSSPASGDGPGISLGKR